MTAAWFRAGGSTSCGITGLGTPRENEDYLFLDSALGLFAVFDAAGSWTGTGERTGPVASAAFRRVIREAAGEESRALIGHAFGAAGEAIREEMELAGPEDGDCCGCSVVLALVRDERVHISWLGDAMAHRVTGGQIEPLTQPHTVWNELVRRGTIDSTNEATANQRFRNVLMHFLGGELPDPLEVISFEPQPGDRLVLTTDGVTNHISADTILNACRTISEPTTCAEAIIEHAIMAGSRDNCTCAVLAFGGT